VCSVLARATALGVGDALGCALQDFRASTDQQQLSDQAKAALHSAFTTHMFLRKSSACGTGQRPKSSACAPTTQALHQLGADNSGQKAVSSSSNGTMSTSDRTDFTKRRSALLEASSFETRRAIPPGAVIANSGQKANTGGSSSASRWADAPINREWQTLKLDEQAKRDEQFGGYASEQARFICNFISIFNVRGEYKFSLYI
jgi:hypothetical protein